MAGAAAVIAACAGLVAAQAPVTPELFGEGVISTPDYELNAAFLPDGRTVYFTKSTANLGFWTIVSSRLEKGGWSEPEVAPFSGQHSDADLAVTPDGRRLVFISDRPVPGAPARGRRAPHIWFVDRVAGGWSEPRNAAALNSEAGEYYPSVAADGTLYFESARPGGRGRADVYRSRPIPADGEYGPAENLGAPLNSEFNEGDAAVAPDQRFMILTITGRPDDLGAGDLYLSEQENGAWSRPRPLAAGVNSPSLEFCPSLSPDGRFLYFTSTRGFGMRSPGPAGASGPRLDYRALTSKLRGVLNGLGNVYRVPVTGVRPRRG